MKKTMDLYLVSIMCAAIFFSEAADVFAKPPPWAPAHGYRNKKAHQNYVPGDRFGILDGRCYRRPAGDYLGRMLGDSAARRIDNYEGRVLASVAGILLGDVFDRQFGSRMDDIDHFCTGQSLEYARDNQIIRWTNPNNYTDYRIEPLKRFERKGRVCRDFISERNDQDRKKRKQFTACRQDNGVWRIE